MGKIAADDIPVATPPLDEPIAQRASPWWLVPIGAVLGLLCAFAALSALPTVHRATATLEITGSQAQIAEIGQTILSDRILRTVAEAENLDREASFLSAPVRLSLPVLVASVQRLMSETGVIEASSDDIVNTLARRITVSAGDEPDHVLIQVDDTDELRAKRIADRAAQVFVDSLAAAAQAKEPVGLVIMNSSDAPPTNQVRRIDPDIIDDLRKKAEEADARVAHFRKDRNFAGDASISHAERMVRETSERLTQARIDAGRKVRERDTAKSALQGAGAEALQTPVLEDLRRRRALLSAREATDAVTLLPNHPKMLAYQDELQALDAEIDAEISRYADRMTFEAELAEDAVTAFEDELQQVEADMEAANQDQIALQALIDQADTARALFETTVNPQPEASGDALPDQSAVDVDTPGPVSDPRSELVTPEQGGSVEPSAALPAETEVTRPETDTKASDDSAETESAAALTTTQDGVSTEQDPEVSALQPNEVIAPQSDAEVASEAAEAFEPSEASPDTPVEPLTNAPDDVAISDPDPLPSVENSTETEGESNATIAGSPPMPLPRPDIEIGTSVDETQLAETSMPAEAEPNKPPPTNAPIVTVPEIESPSDGSQLTENTPSGSQPESEAPAETMPISARLVSPAVLSEASLFPDRSMILFIGGGIGIAIGFLFALLMSISSRNKHSRETFIVDGPEGKKSSFPAIDLA